MPKDLSWADLSMIEPLYLAIGLAKKAKAGKQRSLSDRN